MITVFGGSGFIGSALVRRLLLEGAAVRVVSRRPKSIAPGVEYLSADVSDAGSAARAVAGSEIVFLCTTAGGVTETLMHRDIVQGACNIATACLDYRVRRLVFVSSVSALHLGSAREMATTGQLDARPEQRNFYARAKIYAELALRKLVDRQSLPLVIIRPGIVVGHGASPAHAALGDWSNDLHCWGVSHGTHPLPFVLVEDVASALVAASRAPSVEGLAFDLAGDVYPSAQEYFEQLRRRSRRHFEYIPRRPASAWGNYFLLWALKKVNGRPNSRFPRLHDLRNSALFTPIDNGAAKRYLGWKPNADPERFYHESIERNLPPISRYDLRLRTAAVTGDV